MPGYFEQLVASGGPAPPRGTVRSRRWQRRALALVGMLGATAPVLMPGSSTAAPVGQGFVVTESDLAHILRQIKIAEHHAGTYTAANICAGLVGPAADQVGSAIVADGLRTVDGTCNNLIAGQEKFGAEGVNFPRLTQPVFREADPPFVPQPPGSDQSNPTSYAHGGNVTDAGPRLVSNLIVDQTSANPAAVAAAGAPPRTQGVDGVFPCDNEVQTISGVPNLANYTITFDGKSAVVPADATAGQVYTALTTGADPVFAPLSIEVAGGPLSANEPLTVTFAGTPTNVAELQVDAGLTVTTTNNGSPEDPMHPCTPLHKTLFIENVTTDVGLSPPFNSLFTIFGQFFDHGVDKTAKPGSTVFVPLKADDPLVAGADHVFGTGDDLPPQLRFMTLKRAATDPDGPNNILGDSDDQQEALNTDTPFVDQSQTYTSHPSHQAFVRSYDLVAGRPSANGKLISRADGGQANWGEVQVQAAAKLGVTLTDYDVLDMPMIATDPYGNLLFNAVTGRVQFVTDAGLVDAGAPGTPVPAPGNVKHFSTAFLDDIAHTAVPDKWDHDNNPATPKVNKLPDTDADTGNTPPAGRYDDELLRLHFIAGDGRVNENIALTAVHQIFHSEHNRLVDEINATLHKPGNEALLADYAGQVAPLHATDKQFSYGQRLFQAARFVTEMEYQHLVFEEFARKVQPLINPFAGFAFTQADINPAVQAEFAHAVYRFGHSMLDEDIPRVNENGSRNDIGLLEGFLNPQAYHNGGTAGTLSSDQAAGAIIMGLSDQSGNEIDEFTTETLRNNLLGLPLDLPTLNMTRARSEGIPPLNRLRAQLYAKTNDSQLKPYTDWVDFGLNLKHPESLVNFVAAYGRHPSIAAAPNTIASRRAAANLLVNAPLPGSPLDAADFMNGTGAWANQPTGLNDVDLWIGGLAERTNLFGGLLGSTFNYVFESQLTNLQNSDRLYYLGRTPGMNLRAQLEGNSFAELVMRNTTAHSLKADAFGTADCKFELSHLPSINDPFNGNNLADDLTSECREDLVLTRLADKTIRYRTNNPADPPGINGQSVFNGRDDALTSDRVFGGVDNDTFLGNRGNDIIEGGDGADVALGGEGNDRITDSAGDDVLKGGPGHDVIESGPGLDIIMGGTGKDFANGGANINEIFAGPGDDFLILGQGEDAAQGDGGDDWMEGGDQPDLLQGDSGSLFFTDRNTPGHDVTIGQAGDDDYDVEGGDDIMIADAGIEKSAGAAGFDWYTGARDAVAQNADLDLKFLPGAGAPPPPQPVVDTRDRFNEVEALSGGKLADILRGDSVVPALVTGGGFIGCDAIDQSSLNRIAGLDALVPPLTQVFSNTTAQIILDSTSHECNLVGNNWGEGNIIIGGAGSDLIEGRGADDIIDGDKHLDVRLSVRTDPADPTTEIGSTDLLEHAAVTGDFGPGTAGKTLERALQDGNLDPDKIVIVRQILSNPNPTDIDTAVFSDIRSAYDVTVNGTTITVAHTRPSVGVRPGDGTDTLFNIERLQFADGVVIPGGGGGGGGGNTPATGEPGIAGLAAVEDGGLTADLGTIADADTINLATLAFEWQAMTAPGVWTPVATGAAFTPGDAQVGQALRVVATFQDGQGVIESRIRQTAPVININDAPTGAPTIDSQNARVGRVLTAGNGNVADADGPTPLPPFSFRWQRGDAAGTVFTDIPGATGATYTPVAADVDLPLRVVAQYLDGNGTTPPSAGGMVENVPSAPTRPTRAATGGGRALLVLGRAAVPARVLAADLAAGVPVTLNTPPTTTVVRVRVFAGTARTAAATVFVNVKAGTNKVKLRHAAIMRVLKKGGTFRLEMTPGRSRTDLGTPTVRTIVVKAKRK